MKEGAAVSYDRYTPDEEIDQEHMIIPKALSFLHKGDDTP